MKLAALCLLLLASLSLYAEDPIQDYLKQEKPIWYDSHNDDWRRAHAPEPPPEPEIGSLQEEGGRSLGSFVIYVMYGLIVALILYLIIQFINQWSSNQRVEHKQVLQKERVKRIQVSDLPFQTDDQIDNPKFAMDQAVQQKQWARAIMFGLIFLLTELHKAQHIQLRPGKTNRNYLRELKDHKQADLLQNTVLLFERSFFGHEDISEHDANAICQSIRRSCDELARQGVAL